MGRKDLRHAKFKPNEIPRLRSYQEDTEDSYRKKKPDHNPAYG